MMELLKNDKPPILFLDVNLGNEEMARIIIFEGDSPEEVAEAFSKEHGK